SSRDRGSASPLREPDPEKSQGRAPSDPVTGELKPVNPGLPQWTKVFGEAITQLAGEYPSLVTITAAMPSGTGTNIFQKKWPERFFDVGIAEAHATTFAAGLATQGVRPIVAIYSTFLQRAYDSIIHDVAIQKLPVVFCMDRGGRRPRGGRPRRHRRERSIPEADGSRDAGRAGARAQAARHGRGRDRGERLRRRARRPGADDGTRRARRGPRRPRPHLRARAPRATARPRRAHRPRHRRPHSRPRRRRVAHAAMNVGVVGNPSYSALGTLLATLARAPDRLPFTPSADDSLLPLSP